MSNETIPWDQVGISDTPKENHMAPRLLYQEKQEAFLGTKWRAGGCVEDCISRLCHGRVFTVDIFATSVFAA